MCFINGSVTWTHMLHLWHWQSWNEFLAMFTHLYDSDQFPSILLPQDKTGLTKTRPSGNTQTHIMSWRSVHMPHTGSCIPTFYSPTRLGSQDGVSNTCTLISSNTKYTYLQYFPSIFNPPPTGLLASCPFSLLLVWLRLEIKQNHWRILKKSCISCQFRADIQTCGHWSW